MHQAAIQRIHGTAPRRRVCNEIQKGRIARDPKQKVKFEKTHPCPSTGKRSGACPGYVVDHIRPLKRGGADRPENMQWQTKEAARQKDKTE
jgi:hypothetical protein